MTGNGQRAGATAAAEPAVTPSVAEPPGTPAGPAGEAGADPADTLAMPVAPSAGEYATGEEAGGIMAAMVGDDAAEQSGDTLAAPGGGLGAEEPAGAGEPAGAVAAAEPSGAVAAPEPGGAGEPAGAVAAAEPSGAVAAAEPGGAVAAEEPAGAVAAEEPALAAGEPAGAVAAEEPAVAAGEPVGSLTAPSTVTRRPWDPRRVGRSIGGLWARSLGRLGIGRLWRPGPGVREASGPGGRALALITAMPAILLVAWLVPGIALLLAHRFLPGPMALISVPVAVALTILIAREVPGRWPAPTASAAPRARSARRRNRAWPAYWGLAGTVAIAAGFAVWQLLENSPQFIVSRDPGAYTQFAYWIADHAGLPIPAHAAAYGGIHPGLAFASFGFASHGAAVVPRLTAGLPIVLAAGLWAHGVSGAAAVSPLIGALAVLAVGGLTARLAGPQWAPAGALLVALTVPEIYTSRSAFSETLAQALLFGGLCLVVDSFATRRHAAQASLGGLAIGLTVLAGAGFLLMLLPVIVVAGALLAGRRPQAIPLAAGFLAGVIGGAGAGITLDDPAFVTMTPSWRIIALLAAGLAVVTAAGAVVGLVGRLRGRARTLLAGRPLRWLPEAGAVLVALAAIGLAIRPYLQKVRGPASPYVAALQRLEGLPVDPSRLYAENALYWVIWYVGIPVLLLGLVGLAMTTRLCLRALSTWRDPAGVASAWVLPVAIIGWSLFAVLWQPATAPDQPWASRRLVPVVLPGLIVLAVSVAAWLIGRAHARGARMPAVAAATACFVVAMGVPPAAITFGIALSRPANPATRLALSGLAFRATGGGETAAVERLCGAIPRHSSVLLLDNAAGRGFAEVVRGTCDVPAGVLAGASPAAVNTVVGGIARAGRRPVLLASSAAELAPYGAAPREVVNLSTQQDEHLLTRPPTATWPVRYTLWMSAPGGIVAGS
jgi:hypothetical protein